MISTETKLDIEGHRGARGLVPENSIPAFKVIAEEGHPEQEPCNNTFTVPSLNE